VAKKGWLHIYGGKKEKRVQSKGGGLSRQQKKGETLRRKRGPKEKAHVLRRETPIQNEKLLR